ncbi:hypothetical protein KOW79_022215 [Hemibagrus wyckioides]|uniref:Secreted protein n=1 Tax=Hemibagrus wyckioides TaxID=337641 RepID=A0A9D3N5S3_9TELE|nr:hypothetical protein KOW79_022215 [Hemibagrus wyckioides]
MQVSVLLIAVSLFATAATRSCQVTDNGTGAITKIWLSLRFARSSGDSPKPYQEFSPSLVRKLDADRRRCDMPIPR